MGFYWTPKVSGFYDWSTQLALLGKSTHACVFFKMKPSSFLRESEAYKKKVIHPDVVVVARLIVIIFYWGGEDQKDVDFKGRRRI